MRHKRNFNHLSRKSAHRKSMLANMAASLILHKRIRTTVAKAKALRTFVEPLITRSKEDSTQSRRLVFKYLQNKDAVTELFREISSKVAERPGGYTRILKLGTRLGDNAEMCLIELVDFNTNLLGGKEAAKAKTTRRGRRGGKKKEEEVTTTPAAAVEEPVKKTRKPAAKKPKAKATAEAEEPAEAAEPIKTTGLTEAGDTKSVEPEAEETTEEEKA
jgi:large subunit ribosomal protein L17